ncbi:hypothetical protein [Pleionea sediminis]|uniref:hypothetical protein n=1 Tax=Pleionea sediminis TaxID=2569479 RepID=UPI001186C8F4|nr:hypothetical protein [Pleionea sediminis]
MKDNKFVALKSSIFKKQTLLIVFFFCAIISTLLSGIAFSNDFSWSWIAYSTAIISAILFVIYFTGLISFVSHEVALIQAQTSTRENHIKESRQSTSKELIDIITIWINIIESIQNDMENSVTGISRCFDQIISGINKVFDSTNNKNQQAQSQQVAHSLNSVKELCQIYFADHDTKTKTTSSFSSQLHDIREAMESSLLKHQELKKIADELKKTINSYENKNTSNDSNRVSLEAIDEQVSNVIKSIEKDNHTFEQLLNNFVLSFHHQSSESSSEQPHNVIDTLNQFESTLTEMVDEHNALEDLQNIIYQNINKTVEHMQFQDRVSQILQHISESLTDAELFIKEDVTSSSKHNLNMGILIEKLKARASTDTERELLGIQSDSSSDDESLTLF